MTACYRTPTDDSYGTRKLAHYNEWLLDGKRTPGVPYPGFPEDIEMVKARKEYVEDFVARAEVKKAKVKAVKPKTKAVVARKSTVPTKQSMATQIYRDLDGDKALVIAKIQEQLVMSLAGATTYYYNAKKMV
jgi:hypothetical protein